MSTSRSKPSDGLDGSRIQLARLTRKLTKAETATQLAISLRLLAQYENGGAPESLGPVLARVFALPVSFFARPPIEQLDAEQVRFRARRRASAAERAGARADGAVGIELYEWLAGRFALPAVNVPDLDHQSPDSAVGALRAHWGLGTKPLPNLVQLAESQGVRVLSLPTRSERVDAFSLWHGDRPYVFLSTAKSAERSRFDLAHELGHLVLHSRGGWDEITAEAEADQFASALLMPEESVLLHGGRNVAVPRLLELRTYYGVSAMAMAHRLHALGRLDDWTYRQDCVFLAQRGFRSAEPGGLARERSRVFDVAFESLRRQGLSATGVGDALGLSPADVHALTFGQAVTAVGAAVHVVREPPPAGPTAPSAPRMRIV